MDSLEYQQWNGRWKRVGIAATVLAAFVALWTAVGQPLPATQSYHDEDAAQIRGLMSCMYWDVPPEDCPWAPPRPPGARR